MTVRVQTAPFDIGAEITALKSDDTHIGAIVTFTGTVRDANAKGAISTMTLEHYPGMTEQELEAIEREAHKKWPLANSLIVHRIGELKPGDDIVLVATTSAHRKAAFEAAEFIMDYLKTRAPFWKNEQLADGQKNWVDARSCDSSAAEVWKKR